MSIFLDRYFFFPFFPIFYFYCLSFLSTKILSHIHVMELDVTLERCGIGYWTGGFRLRRVGMG
ncbi:hypothetical protein BDZ91DRAFT_737787 [Kalaharituber pfeilii]|nr:hypothetical protein BDZ91DRAFT_737787 [Kalaharituber pfeilii]